MPDEVLTVSQADRDAAAELNYKIGRASLEMRRLQRLGRGDEDFVVQAFARHRQSQPYPLAGEGDKAMKALEDKLRWLCHHDEVMPLVRALLASLQAGGQAEIK